MKKQSKLKKRKMTPAGLVKYQQLSKLMVQKLGDENKRGVITSSQYDGPPETGL